MEVLPVSRQARGGNNVAYSVMCLVQQSGAE